MRNTSASDMEEDSQLWLMRALKDSEQIAELAVHCGREKEKRGREQENVMMSSYS